MSLYGPATATASVGANTNVITIKGMDLTVVDLGMTINLGARDQLIGPAWIIASVTPTGQNGGSVTTLASIPSAYTDAPFVIDTRGYQGSEKSYAAEVNLQVLDALQRLTGVATNLYTGSRQLALDKQSSTAVGRVLYQIAGRSWAALEQRTVTFTPTGGQTTSIETMAVRAFSDGTTPTDALLIDLNNGTGDLRRGSVTMASAATVDLGSAPRGNVAITGAATITSFGPGRNLEREVHFTDNGATLTHNATSLILHGRANIVMQAGDTARFTSDAAGNWRMRTINRANGQPLISLFRGGAYTPLATQQYLGAADYGRAFNWQIGDGQILTPLTGIDPGWWCQIRCSGTPIGYGRSSIVAPGYAHAFMLNGRSQFVDTAGTNKGLVVIGGGEEFRFTWTGSEWIVEVIQSPTLEHFTYRRANSGSYAGTPTSFTVIGAVSTSGNNAVAASPFNLGMYAPCSGLYRVFATTRMYNDTASNNYEGGFGLSNQSAADANKFDSVFYKRYSPGHYEDLVSRCTKRFEFGQVVAAYKAADNTNLKSSGNNENFFAELLSRG